jgi:4'-phosphopantetheinyl transferase
MTDAEQAWMDWPMATEIAPPAPDSIQVLAFSLAQANPRVEVLMTALCRDERARAGRFIRQADWRRFVVAHGVTRCVLSPLLACRPEQVVFARGAEGKPRIVQPRADLEFNLAHSGDLGMIAVASGRQVGIDVEHHQERLDWRLVAATIWSAAEQRAVEQLSADRCAASFYAAWARREAALKARGEGLASSAAAATTADSELWMADLPAGSGIAAAVASEMPRAHLRLSRWTLD